MKPQPPAAIEHHRTSTEVEKLLSEASAAFVRALATDIDSEIETWLGRSSVALGIDKAILVQLDPTTGEPRATHQWVQEGVIPNALSEAAQDFPWLRSKIQSGEMVVLEDVNDAPAEASDDLRQARRHGTEAAVVIPLRIGGALAGAVAFVSIVTRIWTAETLRQLEQITQIFGIALERQRSAAIIRELREESQNVLRIVPIAEMTASLAHELNQPLGAILNNAQAVRRLLSARRLDMEELRDAVESIIRDVGRATDVVRHTREAFQSAVDERRTLDIHELLVDLGRVLRNDAQARGISLRVSVPTSLPPVLGNRQALIQVLMNLVLNAFESISERLDGPREVEISAEDASAEVHVKVRDTGKGIEPTIAARLFNAFVTTKPKGTGMGLAIARSVIEKGGGRIWASKQAGPGASIEFTLPVQV